MPSPDQSAHQAATEAAAQQQQRDFLVLESLPIVRSIALRVHDNLPVHVDLEELIQAGVIGLFDAAEKFDPSKNVSFSSYAKHRIKGAILDSLRQADWASRDMRRRHKQLEQVSRELASQLNRNPTEDEVAQRLGIDVGRWRHMMLDLQTVGLISASSRAEGEDLPPLDFHANPATRPDEIAIRQQLREAIAQAMRALPERYRKVVLMYYVQERTMKEIGEDLEINESRVSQIHKAALERMAGVLEEAGIRSSNAF